MTPDMRFLLLLLILAAAPASAQVYRWVDAKGTVHYSNSPPPAGVKSTLIDINAKAGPPSADTAECHTVRCQGERMEQRIARRDELDARLAAQRIAAAPPQPRGLDFRTYIWLQYGMSEGELVSRAGAPDLLFWDPFSVKTYTWLPTAADPFTTNVTLTHGRINGIERIRKF